MAVGTPTTDRESDGGGSIIEKLVDKLEEDMKKAAKILDGNKNGGVGREREDVSDRIGRLVEE